MQDTSIRKTKKLVYTALFLAAGLVLPFFTGQIKEIGDSLLPLHFVVLLASLLLGWKSGLAVGAVLPLTRGILFGMPPIYPSGVWMTFELATYGFLTGFLYKDVFGKAQKKLLALYGSMIISMLAGRVVWGIAKTVILGFSGKKFLFSAFLAEGFVDAIWGIIIQLTVIPVIVGLNERIKRGNNL